MLSDECGHSAAVPEHEDTEDERDDEATDNEGVGVLIHTRVSSDEQASEGRSLESQEEELRSIVEGQDEWTYAPALSAMSRRNSITTRSSNVEPNQKMPRGGRLSFGAFSCA